MIILNTSCILKFAYRKFTKAVYRFCTTLSGFEAVKVIDGLSALAGLAITPGGNAVNITDKLVVVAIPVDLFYLGQYCEGKKLIS